MDAQAASDGSGIIIWRHGPNGEIGVSTIDWARWRQFMLLFCAPTAALFVFYQSWGVFWIFCGGVQVAIEFSKLEGTPSIVTMTIDRWGWRCAGAAAGILLIEYLEARNPTVFLGVAGGLAFIGFFYLVIFRCSATRLVAWAPLGGNDHPATDTSIADLQAMREEIGWSQTSLSSLPVFDDKRPELVAAWEQSDPPRIAHLLQEANLETQGSWKRANEMLNRALSYTDRARHKLNSLLTQTEQRLVPFGIDYQAIEVERSKQAHVEIVAAIPKNLTVRRINAQNLAFIQGGGRAIAQGATGQLPPLAAIAAIGISVVAHYTYKSRTLRRLKEAQGQLLVNAEAARGDFNMVSSLFSTRIIPNFDDMISIASRLEDGLTNLKPDVVDPTNPAQREEALQLAFAMIEGRKLVSTMAGD